MLDPDDTEALELSPHPVVPPTVIVPASLVLISTSGVVSVVGVGTAVCSVGADTAVSSVKGLRVSAFAALPAASVKVIVHLYSLSPSFALRVTVLTPDDTEALDLSPHPAVPPTAIVPASLVLITTFGVALFVGVGTAVCSVGVGGGPVLYVAAKPALLVLWSAVNFTYIEPLAAVTVFGRLLPLAVNSIFDDADVPSYTLT
jgi:hypothetical protein